MQTVISTVSRKFGRTQTIPLLTLVSVTVESKWSRLRHHHHKFTL